MGKDAITDREDEIRDELTGVYRAEIIRLVGESERGGLVSCRQSDPFALGDFQGRQAKAPCWAVGRGGKGL